MALLGVTLSRTATNMPARKHAAKLAKNLGFSSEKLELPENKYIGWLDLMGCRPHLFDLDRCCPRKADVASLPSKLADRTSSLPV